MSAVFCFAYHSDLNDIPLVFLVLFFCTSSLCGWGKQFFWHCYVLPVPCVAGASSFGQCYVTIGNVTLFGVMLYRITRKLLIYKQCYMLQCYSTHMKVCQNEVDRKCSQHHSKLSKQFKAPNTLFFKTHNFITLFNFLPYSSCKSTT